MMRLLLLQLCSCLLPFPDHVALTAAAFTGIALHLHVQIPSKGVWETSKRAICRQPPSKRGSSESFLASSSSISPVVKDSTDTQQKEAASTVELDESSLHHSDLGKSNEAFQELCRQVNAKPSGLLRLDESSFAANGAGIRGVYVQRRVPEGQVILSIPLTSCLRDDHPPKWMAPQQSFDDDDSGDDADDGYLHPSAWATRLAASLLDLQLAAGSSSVTSGSKDETNTSNNNNNNNKTKLWLDLLPNANLLRASLPIHWSDETLQSAQCSALELALDTAFFARAQAREDVLQALNNECKFNHHAASLLDEEAKRRLIDNALDMVQTRSCRVLIKKPSDASDNGDPQPLRLLAPVFDFINHPSQGKANAEFALEDDGSPSHKRLVVRSLRHLEANTEVLIDYGESARPAWRCLSSYGFVPAYDRRDGDDEQVDDEQNQQHHAAEVFVNGVRYQVGPSSVPQEMVAAMAAALDPTLLDRDQEEIVLTKEIAINLGQRIAEDAFYKLLDPPPPSSSLEMVDDEEDVDDDYYNHDALQTPEQILSSKHAAALRFHQHRVLMDCSLGLRDWAIRQRS
jgi:SET domain